LANQDKSGGKQKPKREHDVHVRGTMHTDLAPDQEKRHNAERKEDAATHEAERQTDLGRESHKVWLERFTLVAVVVYAGIAGWQGCISKDLLLTTIRQFQADQRPYVVEDGMTMLKFNDGTPSPPVIGQPLDVHIAFKNAGKTPALNLIIHRHMFFGDHLETLRPEPPDTKVSGEILSQGDHNFVNALSLKDTFANETADFSRDEIVNWDGTEPIVVFGRATYNDSAGNRYCTPYAVRYLNASAWEIVSVLTDTRTHSSRNITDLCPPGTGNLY
jgi:hypothetical protein